MESPQPNWIYTIRHLALERFPERRAGADGGSHSFFAGDAHGAQHHRRVWAMGALRIAYPRFAAGNLQEQTRTLGAKAVAIRRPTLIPTGNLHAHQNESGFA